MAKSKKIITSIIVALILIITGTVVLFITKGNSSQKMGGFPGGGFPGGGFPGGGSFGGGSTVSVRTVVAENTTLTDFVTTNGEIETQTSIEVFPQIGGKVVQMNVSLGSHVEKGDVIGYIDPSEPGSYYAKSPVTAPISGSILSSPVKTGQKVMASSVITKIGDIENLQISAKVPERYVAELKIGQKAEISLEAYPDVVFIASVVRISPVVDSATRTKEIILNFDQSDSRINAGMFAKVKLYTTAYSGHVAIKQDALVNNSDKYYLYVVKEDGQSVSKREVTLGKNVDGYYQILDGVNAGESVVVEGMLSLYDGARIKDIEKEVPAETSDAPKGDMPSFGDGEFPPKGDFPKDGDFPKEGDFPKDGKFPGKDGKDSKKDGKK